MGDEEEEMFRNNEQDLTRDRDNQIKHVQVYKY